MRIEVLELSGAYYIEPEIHLDNRGFFFEWFQKVRFQKETGIDFNIEQLNYSKSTKSVLRGLHYQLNPYAQAKLIAVIKGEIQDVIVDIRKNSNTYGKYYSTILNAEKKNQLYVPKGFAHGFLVLSEEVELLYGVNCTYVPDYDCGILFKDKSLNIKWQIQNPIVSEKDKILKSFKECENNF